MRGAKKDLLDLLKRAEKAGAVVTRTGGDHFKITGPKGSVFCQQSPRSNRATTTVKQRLKRIAGVEVD